MYEEDDIVYIIAENPYLPMYTRLQVIDVDEDDVEDPYLCEIEDGRTFWLMVDWVGDLIMENE